MWCVHVSLTVGQVLRGVCVYVCERERERDREMESTSTACSKADLPVARSRTCVERIHNMAQLKLFVAYNSACCVDSLSEV